MNAYIFDAVRSPRGKARRDGGLASLKPEELVRQLSNAIFRRTDVEPPSIDALYLGCVGQVNDQGGNIALVSKLHSRLPDNASSWTINNYCVSGLTAIGQAAANVRMGHVDLALAGGVEMMSRVTFMADQAGYYADMNFPARTRYVPVAIAADRLAQSEHIGRAEMDEVALASQAKAAASETNEILMGSRIAITDTNGAVLLDRDECIRKTSVESLTVMQPAFPNIIAAYSTALEGETVEPVHTAAHAPPMSDGAGLTLVGVENAVAAAPRARIVAYAESGGDPHAALTAGFAAMEKVLGRAGMTLGEIDQIEFMEAFAVTFVKFIRDYEVDPNKVNVAGGHLARGHALGATGAILLSTLLDNLDSADGKFGLVVASAASGAGSAMIVERL